MGLEVLYFGSLLDITSCTKQEYEGFANTDLLLQQLLKEYPALQSTKYLIAVNQQMIQGNTVLNNGDKIALMPPFSGG